MNSEIKNSIFAMEKERTYLQIQQNNKQEITINETFALTGFRDMFFEISNDGLLNISHCSWFSESKYFSCSWNIKRDGKCFIKGNCMASISVYKTDTLFFRVEHMAGGLDEITVNLSATIY